VAILAALSVLVIAVRIVLFILPMLVKAAAWVILTIYDFALYLFQSISAWRSGTAPAPTALLIEVLVGIAICSGVVVSIWHWAQNHNAYNAVTISAGDAQRMPEIGDSAPNGQAASISHRLVAGKARTRTKVYMGSAPVATAPLSNAVSPDPVMDDLATVRAADSAAATSIATHCSTVSAGALNDKDAILAKCRLDEIAAWQRLVVGQEFPAASDTVKKICTSPPFPASFVAEEACEKYETTRDTAPGPDR
jgi:hypothetical protein